MITSGGPKCDVCGRFIMPVFDEMVNEFTIIGIARVLHADNHCKAALIAAGNDWHKLPNGPLRKVFEEQNDALVPDNHSISST